MHITRGGDYENKADRMLSHLFDSYNLVPINDGQPILLLSPNSRRSVIDLVVVSSDLAPFDSAGSDHFRVIAHIGGTPTKKCQFKYKLKIGKKDALLFNHNLD